MFFEVRVVMPHRRLNESLPGQVKRALQSLHFRIEGVDRDVDFQTLARLWESQWGALPPRAFHVWRDIGELMVHGGCHALHSVAITKRVRRSQLLNPSEPHNDLIKAFVAGSLDECRNEPADPIPEKDRGEFQHDLAYYCGYDMYLFREGGETPETILVPMS